MLQDYHIYEESCILRQSRPLARSLAHSLANKDQEDKLANTMQKGSVKRASNKPSGAETLSVEGVYTLTLDSLENSKAEKVQPIEISKKSSIGDYMIIASGRSHRHVGAIADHLLRALKAAGVKNPRIEGQQNGDWVLIDIGDIIVHIFRPEVRKFYNLEKMWMLPVMPEASVTDS
jgi:ribosome-associated protein